MPEAIESLDGVSVAALAVELRLSELLVYRSLTSTQDVLHQLAEHGAADGTVVVADEQTAGRGRMGRSWASAPGAGLWCSLLSRPAAAAGAAGDSVDEAAEHPQLMSIRVGLAVATALDAVAGRAVRLKWPNDLVLDNRKLGGILIESRWRGNRPDWTVIGVGINLATPAGQSEAIGLHEARPASPPERGTAGPGGRGAGSRVDVLRRIVPGIRLAAMHSGRLSPTELAELDRRDVTRHRRCIAPRAGVLRGIDASGAVTVDTGEEIVLVRSGTLVLAEES